jgi:hypothetical protein
MAMTMTSYDRMRTVGRRSVALTAAALLGLTLMALPASAATGTGTHSGRATFDSDPAGTLCTKVTNFKYTSTYDYAADEEDTGELTQDGSTYEGPLTVTFTLEDGFYQNMVGTFSDSNCTDPATVAVTSWRIEGDEDMAVADGEDSVSCKWDGGTFARQGFTTEAHLPPEAGGCKFNSGERQPTRVGDVGQSTGCNEYPPTACDSKHTFTAEDVTPRVLP